MALAKVRYRRGEEYLEVVGLGKIISTDAGLVATCEALEPAGMTSLQTALHRYEESWGSLHGDIHVTHESEDEIDDETQVDQTSLAFENGRLRARTFIAVFETQPDEQVIRRLAEPMLYREGMSIADLDLLEEKWGWGVWLTFEIPTRRRSVGDVLRSVDLVSGAIEGAYPEKFDVASAAFVIKARHPELLVGMFENEWLDTKSAPYRLDEKSEQYELAKDVASFANADGGLILLGAKTKRRPEGDEIQRVNGCGLTHPHAAPAALRSVLERWIYPRAEGVIVEQISLSGKDHGVVLIQIPKQAESQKPFLVASTKSGDRVSKLGFTYAVREGEGTDAPRIEVIHQLIRAGKAALAQEGSLSEVEALRADLRRLEAANLETWVSDIVLAAAKNGFHVRQVRDSLTFQKGDVEPIKIQATTPGPPADLLHRQKLLEWLAERGLPVRTNAKGFLEPVQE
jgi:hypothetical protein